jgi:hypothetical protein
MCTKQCLLISVYNLREFAWRQANSYKYDPVAGPMHEKYLKQLNEILVHQEKVEAINE